MFIFDLKFSNLHLGDHGVLHGWSLSNKLFTCTLLQEEYTRLNPELVLAPDIVPSSLVFRIRQRDKKRYRLSTVPGNVLKRTRSQQSMSTCMNTMQRENFL